MISTTLLVLATIIFITAAIVRIRINKRIKANTEKLANSDLELANSDLGDRTIASVVAGVAALIAIVSLLSSVIYTQDPGEAIVIRSASGNIARIDINPGFGLKAPWSTKVDFDVRNQRIEMYKNASGVGPDGASIELGLKGGASASTSVVVRYSIRPESVGNIYREFKKADNLIERELRPAVRDAVRDAASGYEAFSIKENRSKVATDVEKILSERWEKYGINVEGVDLGNIDLDKATEAAIQKVNVSRQRVETARNELDASRISAEKTKVDAQAQADADQIVRCGATVAVSEETVAGKQVRSTVITPKSGVECEERLNQQVLTSKYFDTLQSIGAKGNMIVVVPEGGNDTILNLPTPRG